MLFDQIEEIPSVGFVIGLAVTLCLVYFISSRSRLYPNIPPVGVDERLLFKLSAAGDVFSRKGREIISRGLQMV